MQNGSIIPDQPASRRDRAHGPAARATSVARLIQQKKPRDLATGPGALSVCFEKSSRELSGCSVLGPATCCEPGKRPGPPPAAVKTQTVVASHAGTESTNIAPENEARQFKLHGQRSRPGPMTDPAQTWSILTVRLWSRSAAARRATRRLPLGEPPLVITTHAITSFRSSLPDPAGDQPRARSGSSPSRHGSTTRKSAESLCHVSTDTDNLSILALTINSQAEKTSRTAPAVHESIEPGDGRAGRTAPQESAMTRASTSRHPSASCASRGSSLPQASIMAS